ncbi:N-acetylmuramoyl-L-alanine amidase [Bacillus sp. EB106-08-02-XG196]|jgi:N-acetylmuramoyl-L-alanine amidase|uniref:N-acetylmuramoyl-L-alanine amidase n=1 Tax=Bacillus sp. EB106-08-02-XG196 TaxID=2737049 RepID=UPI0015C4369C|nr:N-acetylmuramoyl-L-alanine amidase [Bacillus sp. EB106-08-02-XG196]NWQ39418.1 N-acetylmuramoyl-L-alanine amidase [Bacillus sp. EB106-08-02-XG196]
MKFMLDAGHGYNTAGKRTIDGMREYEFTRKVAAFARDLLTSYQNVTVYFAHSDERDVPLQERTNTANRLNVDAYVSIHANAYGSTWNDANGIETYVYTTNHQETYQLAQKVQNNMVSLTGLRSRGVKTASFHVLRETNMPAILVECGFMTNRNEAGLMRTEDFQRKCALAIVNALAAQYNLTKKAAPPPSTPKPPSNPAPSVRSDLFKVQAGAFSEKSNADAHVKKLKSDGFEAFVSTDGLYKVQAGAFSERKNAEALVARLKAKGYQAFIFTD